MVLLSDESNVPSLGELVVDRSVSSTLTALMTLRGVLKELI